MKPAAASASIVGVTSLPNITKLPNGLRFRYEANSGDIEAIRDIVASTGFFNEAEVGIAVELVTDRVEKGPQSPYHFVFLDDIQTADGKAIPVGYTCYGHIDGTAASYDLYWIAVHSSRRGQGLGRWLMDESERLIAEVGGDGVYVETSSRPQYDPTRHFYLRQGYLEEARLRDFYGPDDAKVFYVKRVGASRTIAKQ